MNLRLPQQLGVMPFFAGVTGVVIMLGTLVGQGGNTNSADNTDPMSGMNMGTGSAMSSMPGMSGGSSAGMSPGSGNDSTMQMPDGSTMASAAMPAAPMNPQTMDMSDPNMAGAMPGGLHTTCSGSTCTVLFASDATGTAQVLGTTAKLDKASGKQLVLTVGKKKLTLRPGKPVTDGKVKVEMTKAAGKSYTVTFTKAH